MTAKPPTEWNSTDIAQNFMGRERDMDDMPERIWAWEIDHAYFPGGHYALEEAGEAAPYISEARHKAELAAVLDEIERLREGHAEIIRQFGATKDGHMAVNIARAALKGKDQ